MRNTTWLLVLASAALLASCSCDGGEPTGPRNRSDSGSGSDAGGMLDGATPSDSGPRSDGATRSDGAVPAGNLPCDVAQVFATYCWSCHGATPTNDAPMALMTLGDLTAASLVDPSATNAERSVLRMRSTSRPMPATGPAVPEADIATVEAWMAAGTPAGPANCDVHDPFDTPTVCTSNIRWFLGNLKSELMHPGGACITCHMGEREAPTFSIAGTVYPTAHEPDDCFGSNVGSDAVIEITGADGAVTRLSPNRSGNFDSTGHVALPYRARLLYQGRERAMTAPQTSGDCNSCHTEDGTMDAPGRIVLP